jgi:hypothetical protein
MIDQTFVAKSARVRPATTALRAIGRGQQPAREPLGLVLSDGDRDAAAGEQRDRGHVPGIR